MANSANLGGHKPFMVDYSKLEGGVIPLPGLRDDGASTRGDRRATGGYFQPQTLPRSRSVGNIFQKVGDGSGFMMLPVERPGDAGEGGAGIEGGNRFFPATTQTTTQTTTAIATTTTTTSAIIQTSATRVQGDQAGYGAVEENNNASILYASENELSCPELSDYYSILTNYIDTLTNLFEATSNRCTPLVDNGLVDNGLVDNGYPRVPSGVDSVVANNR